MLNDRYVRHPKRTTDGNDWRGRAALGLPEGSIRALLALLLCGTIWGLLAMAPGRDLPGSLRDLLFIILGHYFASRKRATAEGTGGPPPLYLPRGTVRLILILGFVATAAMLGLRGGLDAFPANPAGLTLLLVGSFLLGVVLRRYLDWLTDDGQRPHRWIEDLKAIAAVAAASVLAVLVWDQARPFLAGGPLDGLADLHDAFGPSVAEELMAAVVGFYFGSRS